MRGFIVGLLLICGCDGGSDATLCADLLVSQSDCMPEAAVAECEAAVEACGDRVAVLESCPLQFSCGG